MSELIFAALSLISSFTNCGNQPPEEIIYFNNNTACYQNKVYKKQRIKYSEKDINCAVDILYHENKSAFGKNNQALYNIYTVITNRSNAKDISLCKVTRAKGQWSAFSDKKANKYRKTALWQAIKKNLTVSYIPYEDAYKDRFRKITGKNPDDMIFFAAYRVKKQKYHGPKIAADKDFCKKQFKREPGHIFYAAIN
jgi:hypothetical protein